jgi:hypothetical protein
MLVATELVAAEQLLVQVEPTLVAVAAVVLVDLLELAAEVVRV